MSMALVAGGVALGSYLSARSRKKEMEKALRKARRDFRFAMSDGQITRSFENAKDRYEPTIAGLRADAAMAGQAVGTSINARMHTSGLSDTGIGMALGGGAVQGMNFRNRQLVADMDMSAMQEALSIQTQKANAALALVNPSMQAAAINPLGEALQGASAGAGAYGNYQNQKALTQYRSDYMEYLQNQNIQDTEDTEYRPPTGVR